MSQDVVQKPLHDYFINFPGVSRWHWHPLPCLYPQGAAQGSVTFAMKEKGKWSQVNTIVHACCSCNCTCMHASPTSHSLLFSLTTCCFGAAYPCLIARTCNPHQYSNSIYQAEPAAHSLQAFHARGELVLSNCHLPLSVLVCLCDVNTLFM